MQSTQLPNSMTISEERKPTVLALFYFLSIYLELPMLLPGDRILPAYTAFIASPFVLAIIFKRFKREEFMFVVYLSLILFLSALLSPRSITLIEKYFGIIQTSASFFIGILTFKLITALPAIKARSLYGYMWMGLIFLAILEVLGPLQGISDIFRETVFNVGGYTAYSNDYRDLLLIGNIRPKVFSSEPSMLAIGIMVFLTSWTLMKPTVRNIVINFIATIFAALLVGSPIIILSPFFSIILFTSNIKNVPLIAIGAPLTFIILALTFYLGFLDPFLSRFSNATFGIDIGRNTSENIRIFLPFYAVATVMQSYPLFGIGISGNITLEQLINSTLDPIFFLGNNTATILIYLGIVGTILVAVLFSKILKYYQITPQFIFFVFFILFGMTMGGFQSPRFWGYLFIFLGSLYHSSFFRPVLSSITKTKKQT